jgi:hypothetical protein
VKKINSSYPDAMVYDGVMCDWKSDYLLFLSVVFALQHYFFFRVYIYIYDDDNNNNI